MESLENLFNEHFEFFKNKMLKKENFVFARYADGERMILQNLSILNGTQAFNVDKWKYHNNTTFSNDLLKSCSHTENNYYYAISCSCCDPEGLKYYKNLLKTDKITFANLWINANYKKFINFISSIDSGVVLIANENCLKSNYPFNVKQKIDIKNDCVNWYEHNKNFIIKGMRLLANKYNNTLFLVSAGPLSEILIHNLYETNPNNIYIDVGSSLDTYTHNKLTRPYQNENSIYSKKECVF
jgi:hypothetical protein